MNIASGAPNPIYVLTLPGAAAAGYTPGTVLVLRGRALYYLNLDVAPHNVRSITGLFNSGAPVGVGKRDIVAGVERLKKGKYGFYCTLHPNMRGTLQVR